MMFLELNKPSLKRPYGMGVQRIRVSLQHDIVAMMEELGVIELSEREKVDPRTMVKFRPLVKGGHGSSFLQTAALLMLGILYFAADDINKPMIETVSTFKQIIKKSEWKYAARNLRRLADALDPQPPKEE